MANNYVRFQRGTLAAYTALLEKGQLDANTLYFIYDEAKPNVGSLYMGDKLISNGEADATTSASSLNELTDVEVTNAVSDSFLVKDADKWVAKTPADVAALIQEHLKIEAPVELEGDNLSVEIIENVVQLKNYGSNYYAFVPAVTGDDGEVIEASKYVLTEGFKAGLEPRVEENVDGTLTIAWYEPSSESIDGLNASIQTINEAIDNLDERVGLPASEGVPATGVYSQLDALATLLNGKAEAEDVYTKAQTDSAIAAAVAGASHLQRKIVNSTAEIDVTAPDAELYIYMVPTGFQAEADKYDEYIVINGTIEKVGSWEVDLSDYVTKNELLITSVASDFTVDENKKLHLNNLSANKIEDLAAWLNTNAATTKGLSENNLTDELFTKLNTSLLIKSINTNELTLSEEKELSINEINQSKIIGLVDALNSKASANEVSQLKTTVENLAASMDNYVSKETYEADIADIKEALTWKDI